MDDFEDDHMLAPEPIGCLESAIISFSKLISFYKLSQAFTHTHNNKSLNFEHFCEQRPYTIQKIAKLAS